MNAKASWALNGYLMLARMMTPVWRWALQKRLLRGKETPQSLAQKWVTQPAPRPDGPLVWGHAVGVGEAMALAGLFAQMSKLWPQANFLITTTARTSGDALHQNGLPPRCVHQFSPIDTPATVDKFLDHWQPALALWCEMDLWPALIHATAQRGIAHALVNARLDQASLAKRLWGRWIYQALLPSFSTLWAQNDETRESLIALGAEAKQVVITGTIKSMAPPLACDATQLLAWQDLLGSRPVWLLASSHPGEESLALRVHELLRQPYPNALLLIAPRAPARGSEVVHGCPSGTLQRSTSTALPGESDAVYVADTIGEMGLWYRLANVAMMGGSWASVGGHNPHEPLALGCHVVHGPNVWNFAESYKDLDTQDLSQLAIDVEAIAQAVSAIWAHPSSHQNRPLQAAFEQLQSLIELAQS